jgi:hypothetical protein
LEVEFREGLEAEFRRGAQEREWRGDARTSARAQKKIAPESDRQSHVKAEFAALLAWHWRELGDILEVIGNKKSNIFS